jgi:hypothetical protein
MAAAWGWIRWIIVAAIVLYVVLHYAAEIGNLIGDLIDAGTTFVSVVLNRIH